MKLRAWGNSTRRASNKGVSDKADIVSLRRAMQANSLTFGAPLDGEERAGLKAWIKQYGDGVVWDAPGGTGTERGLHRGLIHLPRHEQEGIVKKCGGRARERRPCHTKSSVGSRQYYKFVLIQVAKHLRATEEMNHIVCDIASCTQSISCSNIKATGMIYCTKDVRSDKEYDEKQRPRSPKTAKYG